MAISIDRSTGAVSCSEHASDACDHVLRLSHALARTSVAMALAGRGRGGDVGASALLLDAALARAEAPRAPLADERPLTARSTP